MKPKKTVAKFSAMMSNLHLMSKYLRFGLVYTKLHLQPVFISGLPVNPRAMVRQTMADDPRVTYEKLAR